MFCAGAVNHRNMLSVLHLFNSCGLDRVIGCTHNGLDCETL